MLPLLLNVPENNDQWSQFSFAHRDSHDRIRAAIKKQKKVSLTDYQIDPMTPDDFDHFLQNNEQLHDDMNSALGLQSGNLQDAELNDPAKLRTWINAHYQEHYDAETKLGI